MAETYYAVKGAFVFDCLGDKLETVLQAGVDDFGFSFYTRVGEVFSAPPSEGWFWFFVFVVVGGCFVAWYIGGVEANGTGGVGELDVAGRERF